MSSLHHPLFSLVRGAHEEILIHGEITISAGEGQGCIVGVDGSYPARSLLKPFQFLATGLPLGRWRDQAQFAAVVGSVSATESQVEQLNKWYRSSALLPSLKVPQMFPMDEGHRFQLRSRSEAPRQVFHTCYSKHLSILMACSEQGWPLESYLETSHPFFFRLQQQLHRVLGTASEFETVVDGCGLPSPLLRTSQLAGLYRSLACASPDSPEGAVTKLMMDFPEWVGGPGRLDTKLMQSNPGQLIAKEGADGLWAIGVRPSAQYPEGLGIILKLAAGYQPNLARLALRRVADRIGFVSPGEAPSGQQLVFHYELDLATPLHHQ